MAFLTTLNRLAYLAGYAYAGLSCATGILLSSLFLILPIPLRKRENLTRGLVCQLSAGLVQFLRWLKLLDADFTSVAALSKRTGVIVALNHPTYIDAVLIMSQFPNIFCLTKASILRNPWVSAMAQSAGYESNADPGALVENCCKRLQRGETLLVFPEGTRTSTPPVDSFKRGFALMALKAQVPVITVLVTSHNGLFMRKGQPFLQLPKNPTLRYEFKLSKEFVPLDCDTPKEFCHKIETHFRSSLG